MSKRTLLIVGALLAFALAAPGTAVAKKVKGDADRNGIPDKWEIRHGLKKKASPAKARRARKSAARVASADPDRDQLTNLQEYRGKTDPKNADSDGDGVIDGEEYGVVVSFNGKFLRVMMPGGELIQGIVDEDTLVFCEPEDVYGVDDQSEFADVEQADPYAEQGDEFAESSGSGDEPVVFDAETGICGSENITPGTEVIYADEDDGFFSDVTLNAAAISAERG